MTYRPKPPRLLFLLLATAYLIISSFPIARAETFQNPLMDGKVSSDPAFIFVDGWYYFADPYSNPIRIHKSRRLTQIEKGFSATPNLKQDEDSNHKRWAPEISHWNERFYVHLSGTNSAGKGRRTVVYESDTNDALGSYSLKNPYLIGAFDFSLFPRSNGELYGSWGYGNLTIAKMVNPWTFDAEVPRATVVQAGRDWDNNIVEGPFLWEAHGKVYMSFSANNWNTDRYKLGIATFTGGPDDLLADPSKWVTHPDPVFQTANGIKGPGHNSIVPSPDGTEFWNIFHDVTFGAAARKIRAQKINWSPSNFPLFGEPQPGPQTVPSGEAGLDPKGSGYGGSNVGGDDGGDGGDTGGSTGVVSIDSVSSGAAYGVVSANNGQTIYIDRDYTLSELPSGLVGEKLIRTRNDDDSVTANPHLEFTLGEGSDVYIAYSTTANSLPSWMAGWTDTGNTVSAGGAGSFRLYKEAFTAGQVSLGGNERGITGAESNYFVIVDVGAGTTAPPVDTGGGGASAETMDLAVYKFSANSVASTDLHSTSTASAVTSGGGSGYAISASAVDGRLRITTTNNNPNSPEAKRDNGQYATFTVTAEAGYTLALDKISLGIRRDGNSPDKLTVFATTDGGASFITVSSYVVVETTSAFNDSTANLSAFTELQGVTSVEFRIVFHGGSTGISNGKNDFDDVKLVGSLRVGSSSPQNSASYAAWTSEISWGSIPTDQRDRNDDPDGDGFSNRLERALGTNPALSDKPVGYSLNTERMPTGQMQVILRYQKHAADETYELVHSPSLEAGTWSTVNTSGEQSDNATGGYIQTWNPDMNQPKGFASLRLVEMP